MKKNKEKEDLKQMNIIQLNEKLDSLRRELFNTRLNASTAHVKDYSHFKKLRQSIARALTYINQKHQSDVISQQK